jgi:hypothetical protein
MEIQCECGKFRAELKAFPNHTPGRLICYCDDCQSFLHHIKRTDLLDKNGGSEIIPAYPVDIQILSGKENLQCVRLSDKGMYRFFTSCCNTPIANVTPGTPWVGFHRRVYTVKDANKLDQALGPVRSSIMGRFAKGTPPPGTPQKFSFKGFMQVMPFLLKGIVTKKIKPSPFFTDDGMAITKPHVLSKEELHAARASAGFN